MRNLNKQKPPIDTMIKDIRRSIERWNILYPLDKWYRDKYNIRYNSIEHQELDVVDVRTAFEEERLYTEAFNAMRNPKKTVYQPGRGEWLRTHEVDEGLSNQEIEDIYDKIDISKLEGDPDEIILEE